MMITLPSAPVSASARSTASEKKLRPSPRAAGRNCFGLRELLAGQSRVPEPPAIIRQSSNMMHYTRFFTGDASFMSRAHYICSGPH